MMQMIQQAFLPAIVPGMVSTAVLVVLARGWMWRRDRGEDARTHESGAWALGVLFPAAFAFAYWTQSRPFEIASMSAIDLAPVAALLAVVPATLVGLLGRERRGPLAVALAAWAAALPLTLLLALPLLDGLRERALLGLVAFGGGLALAALAARRPGPALPITLMLAFTALSIVTLQGPGGFAMPLAAGGVSAIAGGAVATSILRPRWSIGAGGAIGAAVCLPLFAAAGYAYDYAFESWWPWTLAMAGPFLLWIGEAPGLGRRHGVGSTLLRVAIGALPALIAIGIALAGGGDTGSGGGSPSDYGY